MYEDKFMKQWLKYIQSHNAEAVAHYTKLRWKLNGGCNDSYEVILNTAINELEDGNLECIKHLVENILKDKFGYIITCYDPLMLQKIKNDEN